MLPTLLSQAERHAHRIAIEDQAGSHSYRELLDAAHRVASVLLGSEEDLAEARVAFFVTPGFEWAAVQWGIWRAGGIAVPLALSHPDAELEYVIRDSAASIVVADAPAEARLRLLATRNQVKFLATTEMLSGIADPTGRPTVRPSDRPTDRRAMIIYTSGTTGKPKGVVTTHRNIEAQIRTLIDAWEWTAEDRILLVLPLHHVHGIINVLSCALWAGATCEMLPRFEPAETWKRILTGRLTLFMAVPTIYQRLIAHWKAADGFTRDRMSEMALRMRLMVSGSAALPVSVLEEWKAITGQTLLERYGMTEIGMALSNPLWEERVPGTVGLPLPGVQVRLVNEDGQSIRDGRAGQIEVMGDNVFLEYWNRPEETRAAFTADGWFKTGDTAEVNRGYYRILGRSNVDIIKTGGYKVSALEIEEELRHHPAVADCAVVGLPDPEWGEQIAVAAELRDGSNLTLEELRDWARSRLAPYKIPRLLRAVPTLPRNAMGKVIKPEVRSCF